MFVRINCIHFKTNGYRCAHEDRPKWLYFFRRMCMEPGRTCTIKEQHKRPLPPTAAPPAKRYPNCCCR